MIPDLFIGANPQSANREWNGLIDDLGIWGRALTPEEVAAIYAGGTGASIESLLQPALDFVITNFVYNPDTDVYSVSWPATESEAFTLRYSENLISWINDVTDNISALSDPQDSRVSYANGILTFTDVNPMPGATELYFRVDKN